MGSPSPVHHWWLPSSPGIEHLRRTGPGLPFMHFLVAWRHFYCPNPAVPTHLSPNPSFLGNIRSFSSKRHKAVGGPKWTSVSVQAWPEHQLESQPHCVSGLIT